jgi:tripartite-type tricarboxylate transporter receptor subunit TctC
MQLKSRKPAAFVFACAVAALPGAAFAQAPAWPSKAIRLIIPFAPGGSSDAVGRIVASKLNERLGQPVVVENRPGGGGSIGVDVVAKSAPDGYTLVVGSAGGLAVNAAVNPRLPYDPVKDLAPITMLVTSPFVVAVNPAFTQVNSLRELIAAIKAKPGMPFASGGTGSGMHLAGELFKLLTKLDMTHVPYKGNGPALTDLVGGQVPMAFVDLGSMPPFIKSGRVKVLAVASSKRSSLAPDVPSADEAGLPGWDALGWFGLAAAAGTPGPIVQRLNTETVAILRAPDVRERIHATYNEPAPMSPEEFGAYIRAEIARWTKVVKDSGQKFE